MQQENNIAYNNATAQRQPCNRVVDNIAEGWLQGCIQSCVMSVTGMIQCGSVVPADHRGKMVSASEAD